MSLFDPDAVIVRQAEKPLRTVPFPLPRVPACAFGPVDEPHPALYDAPVKGRTSWAYMCPFHFDIYARPDAEDIGARCVTSDAFMIASDQHDAGDWNPA